jgi:two-component system nitrogen regulation sensor histidine kinase GlnL
MISAYVTLLVMESLVATNRSSSQISWEEILTNLDDGVVTVDPGGKIGFFNEAAQILTDISSAAVAGQPFEQISARTLAIELVHKTRPLRQSAPARNFATAGAGRYPSALRSRRSTIGWNFRARFAMRDIKHRKELEEDLKRADRLATMGTLAAGLAHEIRNPLGGIKGAAQLLRRSLDGPSQLRELPTS